jgi:hypothetical protein
MEFVSIAIAKSKTSSEISKKPGSESSVKKFRKFFKIRSKKEKPNVFVSSKKR